MNVRRLSVFVVLVALGVVIPWVWFEREAPSERPLESGTASLTSPTGNSHPGVTSAAPLRVETSPAPQTLTTKAAEPTRMNSAVSPGMPLVRTAPSPAPPVAAPVPVSPSRVEPQVEGESDLEGVQFMLRDFRTRIGENPVGSNAEIMKTIMGGNEARAVLGPPQGQSLNDQGELVDRWGKPYFFHQLSKNSMEIRSAGPDGRLWTSDDLIAK